jgi:hypothetical protein
MKTVRNLGIAILSGMVLAGCANKVYVQRDESANLAKYKTYMWVDTKDNQDDNKTKTQFADMAVKRTVNDELAKQGWKEVNDHPDVLISYDLLVERTTQQQSDPVYTRPFTRVYYNPFLRRWGTIYYPSQFIGYDTYEAPVKEGTITITMMDAQTDKPVWQAWTTDQLSSTRFTAEEVNRNVHNIFKKFDVAKR